MISLSMHFLFTSCSALVSFVQAGITIHEVYRKHYIKCKRYSSRFFCFNLWSMIRGSKTQHPCRWGGDTRIKAYLNSCFTMRILVCKHIATERWSALRTWVHRMQTVSEPWVTVPRSNQTFKLATCKWCLYF